MSRPSRVALLFAICALAAALHPQTLRAEPGPVTSTSTPEHATTSGPRVGLKTNRSAYEPGLVHVLSAGVSVPSAVTADVYLVLGTPSGQVFSLTDGGAFVPGVFPLARNVSFASGFQFPARAIVVRQLPEISQGPYAWVAALTAPGTLQPISNIARADWQFLGSSVAHDVATLDNGYRISFVSVTDHADGTSTWRYRVEELASAQDLSNWVLELPGCVSLLHAVPEPWEVVRPDPNAGLHGIKWETGAGFQQGEFAFTLDDQWAVGATRVAAKGPDVAFGTIAGPVCEQPLALTLHKSADVATSIPGQVLTYTTTLQNVGDTTAEALVLTDHVPLGASFVANSLHVTTGFGQFMSAENLVFWQGDLAPGQLLTLTFRVMVQPGVADGSTIANTVFAGPLQATAHVLVDIP